LPVRFLDLQFMHLPRYVVGIHQRQPPTRGRDQVALDEIGQVRIRRGVGRDGHIDPTMQRGPATVKHVLVEVAAGVRGGGFPHGVAQ